MFSRTFVINLDRRPDRWKAFCNRLPADWPFPAPERLPACDGLSPENRPPKWFQQPRGGWGCLRSHLAAWRRVCDDGLDGALVLEDDALFCDGFSAKATAFLPLVPHDWGQVYLGGQHYRQPHGLPCEVSPGVLRAWNVNRLHAYVIRADFAEQAIYYVADTLEQKPRQIDYIMGDLHESTKRAYCPVRWLVGQAADTSNIGMNGREPAVKTEQWWQAFHYWDLGGDKQWAS